MNISDLLWTLWAPLYKSTRNYLIFGYFLKKEQQALKVLLNECLSSEITTICELGVGRGHSLNLLPEAYPVTFAIDNNLAMIRYTRDNYPNTFFLLADILHLPIKNSTVDLIQCIGVAEYLPEIGPLLQSIYSKLKKGGFVVITFSPKKVITHVRLLSGHKIYARNSSQVRKHISDNNFTILDEKSTPLQIQYLLKK